MASIILHGGAGSGGYGKNGEKALEKALAAGKKYLARSSVDAVAEAICCMEDSGIFDAGKGSYYQLDGKIRMDASIMTSEMRCGAVAGIEEIRNPIRAARKVMELTDHVMLSGIHATKFALKCGLSKGRPGTANNRAYWKKLRSSLSGKDFMQTLAKLRELRKERYFSTVGCVALDDYGLLCAGTSTGGIGIMLPGRVGDTPLIGCGTYCSAKVGCSSTGIGEDIIRFNLARKAVEECENGVSKSDGVIAHFERQTHSKAGIIVLDKKGDFSASFNTKMMLWKGERI